MDRGAEQEALRRRLYRPGATEDDRRRYLALTPPEEPVVAPAPRPARRRSALPVVLVAAVALVLATGVAVARSASTAAVAVRPPAPTASAILPSQEVSVWIDGATRNALRVEGTGDARIPLDVAGVSYTGGRLAVVLASSDRRPVGWRVLALETRRDWTSYPRLVASGPVVDRYGDARPEVVPYADVPPRWVSVRAPADALWTLTVAFER